MLSFVWQVPPGQAGGEYTLRVSYPNDGLPPAERKFDVRAYRPPRLKSQIVFLRDGYGPGDAVTATVKVERAEGGLPAGAKTTTIARVDGAEVYRGETTIDEAGCCTAKFNLPQDIQRGDGTLAFRHRRRRRFGDRVQDDSDSAEERRPSALPRGRRTRRRLAQSRLLRSAHARAEAR